MIKLAAAKNLLFWNNNFIVFYRILLHIYIYVIAFREDNLLGFFVIAGRG